MKKKPFHPLLFLALAILSDLLSVGCQRSEMDARLDSPASLLQTLVQSGAPVFITPEFLPCIAPLPPPQRALFPTASDSESASREKSLFWKLHRETNFSTLLIGASPAWKPLTFSLLNSPLWVLTDVSPWGYLFKPKNAGVAPWQIPSEEELQTQWPHNSDRARFLILTAGSLAAINRLPEAEQLLAKADSLHKLPTLLLGTKASIAASRGHWEEAMTLAKSSLHADSDNRAAQEILIRALIETGHDDEALNQAINLVARDGENTDTLFLLARAANAANSDKEEIEALVRLVAVARSKKQPLGASLTYLGQAYAKQGDRGEALRTFQQASVAPELSEQQRKMIRDIMDHLMEGDRSSSTLPALKPSPSGTP
jgi:hypothetical protein